MISENSESGAGSEDTEESLNLCLSDEVNKWAQMNIELVLWILP